MLDEAHLYRGAAGAEVGLLLRRLRDRLGVPAERFQVICATASFNDAKHAPEFGAQLSGIPADTFIPITGSLDLRAHSAAGSDHDARVLAAVDLQRYYDAATDAERLAAVQGLLDYRHVKGDSAPEAALYRALADFGPMGLLVNATMEQALPIAELGRDVFPTAPREAAGLA